MTDFKEGVLIIVIIVMVIIMQNATWFLQAKKANDSALKLASFWRVFHKPAISRDIGMYDTDSSTWEWCDSSSMLHCSDLVTLQN